MRLPLNIGTLPGVPVKSYILIFNEEWPHFWMLEALSHAKKVFLPLDQDTWEGKFYKHLGIAWLCNVQGSIWYNHILQYSFLTPNFCKIHSTFFLSFGALQSSFSTILTIAMKLQGVAYCRLFYRATTYILVQNIKRYGSTQVIKFHIFE